MFPEWFRILFYVVLYGFGIPFMIYAGIKCWKDLRWSLKNPVEYEDEYED